VLIKALEHADSKLFCQVLEQLSAARDPAVARYVTAYLSQEKFLQRPVEERRAIYAAIASTSSDEVVPELEQALNGGNWFDRTRRSTATPSRAAWCASAPRARSPCSKPAHSRGAHPCARHVPRHSRPGGGMSDPARDDAQSGQIFVELGPLLVQRIVALMRTARTYDVSNMAFQRQLRSS
jgi:hypothetical protein